MSEKHLTPQATAERLGVTVGTLANWRTKNRGPSYLKVGRSVRYRARDLIKWERDRVQLVEPESV